MTRQSLGPSERPASGRALGYGLWIAQIVLSIFFVGTGVEKTTEPIAELSHKYNWPGDVPAALVRFIGVAELLGAIGLVLPGLTKKKPALTVWAAAGLLLVMVLAAALHVTRGELHALPMNVALGALAGFVLWGRRVKARATLAEAG